MTHISHTKHTSYTHTHTVLTLIASKGGMVNESAGMVQTCVRFSNPIARDIELERNTQAGMSTNSSVGGITGIGEWVWLTYKWVWLVYKWNIIMWLFLDSIYRLVTFCRSRELIVDFCIL